MIDKCANPACNKPTVYLRSGVLYEVDTFITSHARQSTHFFWLCEACSHKYDLRFSEQMDPIVVPLHTPGVQHESESAYLRVQRIFVNQHPPGFMEATVDYADI